MTSERSKIDSRSTALPLPAVDKGNFLLNALKLLFSGPSKEEARRPRINYPANTFSEIFSIGDVHGCLEELLDAEQRIASLADMESGRRLIVLIGDYVDRGPRSFGVLDHLSKPPPPGFERICLCGNHDDAFYKFIVSPKLERDWLHFGGVATLYSYGVDAAFHLKADPKGTGLLDAVRNHIPADHVEFLKNAPVALSIGKFIFVHAGIMPGYPLEDQNDADLMWIREPFLSEGPQLDVIVVHGHTPTENIVFGKRRIGLDTGAYMTGRLNVLRINRRGYSII